MSTSVCDVPKIKTDDTITTIPVNGAPPGEIQTLVTKHNIVKSPKSQSKQSIAEIKTTGIKMGNQQGSDSGKNNSKKKGQAKRGSKKSSEKSGGSPKKGKSSPTVSKDTPPSPNKTASEKNYVQQAAGVSALETSTTSDVFSEAVDQIEGSVQNVSTESTKRRESSSGDNISFQSFATPLSTPLIHRAKQKSPTCNPADRVDELGKSIQRTIIERFSSNSPEPPSTDGISPNAHQVTDLPQIPVRKEEIHQKESRTATVELSPSVLQPTTNPTGRSIPQQVIIHKKSHVEASEGSNETESKPAVMIKPISEKKTEAAKICDELVETKESVIKVKCSEVTQDVTGDNTLLPCVVHHSGLHTEKGVSPDKSAEVRDSVWEQQGLVDATSAAQSIVEELLSNVNCANQPDTGQDFNKIQTSPKSTGEESDLISNVTSNASDLATSTQIGSIQLNQETVDEDKRSLAHEPLMNTSDGSSNGESSLETIKSELSSLFISETDIATPQDNAECITNITTSPDSGQSATPLVESKQPVSAVKTPKTSGDNSNSITNTYQLPKPSRSAVDKKSKTAVKSVYRKSFTNDPLMDNLLMLIKQTLEADDNDYECDVSAVSNTDCSQQVTPKEISGIKTETNPILNKTVGSMFLSADGDEEKTLTPDDMNAFKQLKSSAYMDSDDIGNMDDDTLTPEDLAEFNRIKKTVLKAESGTDNQTENDDEFSYSSTDKFDLSSGETTEDSVIERPFKKVPVLAATQEEDGRQQPSADSVSSTHIPGKNKDAVPPLEDVGPSPINESAGSSNPDRSHVEVRQRSLTEEEIRREIRKFMIPEMKEALPKTGGLNRMLDDLHDITPTSENYPDFGDGDREVSPEYGNSSGLRSRTSITSSELDISEHRDDVSTDSMYADDEDDSSSEVLFCKTYTEPERGTEVLVSCTVVNSAHKKNRCSSDEFWAESSAPEDAYQQVEIAADAVNKHFTHARSQMQDIQHHLKTLRHQMQNMEKQVVKTYTLPSTDEYDFEEVERRAITD